MLVALLSLSIGAFEISISNIILNNLNDTEKSILFSIRLPRILLSALVGAALAISGAAIQGLFRNPLADPGLIGISGGAALGAALAIVLPDIFSGFFDLYIISIAAFIGGAITCFIIFNFARFNATFSVTYMLLAGIAINALTGAATGFLTYLSDDQQLRSLTFWMMGNFGGALWTTVMVCFSVIVPASIYLIKISGDLNILSLGENQAKYLGVDIEKLKKKIVILVAFLVGVCVASSGIIGFVGLVVPHLIRIAISPNHKLLLPASALLGASLLAISDSFARTIIAPLELPVGIVTSLIGGPFFLWILAKKYAS